MTLYKKFLIQMVFLMIPEERDTLPQLDKTKGGKCHITHNTQIRNQLNIFMYDLQTFTNKTNCK